MSPDVFEQNFRVFGTRLNVDDYFDVILYALQSLDPDYSAEVRLDSGNIRVQLVEEIRQHYQAYKYGPTPSQLDAYCNKMRISTATAREGEIAVPVDDIVIRATTKAFNKRIVVITMHVSEISECTYKFTRTYDPDDDDEVNYKPKSGTPRNTIYLLRIRIRENGHFRYHYEYAIPTWITDSQILINRLPPTLPPRITPEMALQFSTSTSVTNSSAIRPVITSTLTSLTIHLPPTGTENLPSTGAENLQPTGAENVPPTGTGNVPPTGTGNVPLTGTVYDEYLNFPDRMSCVQFLQYFRVFGTKENGDCLFQAVWYGLHGHAHPNKQLTLEICVP